MPVNFPNNPSLNDTFEFNGRVYTWDGEKWTSTLQVIEGPEGPAGPEGPVGPAGVQGPEGPTGATGPGVATGGNADDLLFKNSSTDFDTEFRPSPFLNQILNIQNISTNTTIDGSSVNATLFVTSSTITLTLANAPVGYQALILNKTGTVTFSEGSGMTIISSDNADTLSNQNSLASIIKISATEWLITGDIE